MDELKPCPHCLEQPEVKTRYEPSEDGADWKHTDIFCPHHQFIHDAATWNSRPVEDDLRKQLEQARAYSSLWKRAAKHWRQEFFCGLLPRTNLALDAAEEWMGKCEQARAALRSVDPWMHLDTYQMKCKFCDNDPGYSPHLDPEDEFAWHKPDCIWLAVYNAVSAQPAAE